MGNALRSNLLVQDPDELSPDMKPIQAGDARLAHLKQRAEITAETWKTTAATKARQLRLNIVEKSAELKNKSQARTNSARVAFNKIRQERPFVMIGAAAATGLLVGVVLRVWRERRA